ncbi:hypothetical protein [Lignipirellula cremea]|uniref:Uncharacterized protein n=1 Tax=Lignipirellula cremea TaxID=2528010 RepID=A0A518DVJ3_9BACT|nr:hypothetical protein [Lignipirellula cremea]QDU95844.1 hypothetical protein Pla8534_36630 [Lignipirellula cremea]
MQDDSYSLTLRPRKWDSLKLLLGSAVFTGLGLWMTTQNWWGYPIAAFFALCALVALAQFLPGSTYLRLTAEGFTMAVMYRQKKTPWEMIDGFFVIDLKSSTGTLMQMVGYNYRPEIQSTSPLHPRNAGLTPCDNAIPDSIHSMPAHELTDLMNTCLASFTNRPGEPPDAVE